MQAKLFFYLDSNTFCIPDEETVDRLKQLVRSHHIVDEDRDWYNKYAAAMGLPPNLLGCLDFEEQRGQWLMHDSNHKPFDFGPDGFEMPSFMRDRESQIEHIEAEVYFYTKKKRGKLHEGEYLHPGTEKQSLWDYFRDSMSSNPIPVNDWSGLSQNICGVLHFEVLSDGRERYKLVVDHVPNLWQLSRLVSRLRAGRIQPTMAWS